MTSWRYEKKKHVKHSEKSQCFFSVWSIKLSFSNVQSVSLPFCPNPNFLCLRNSGAEETAWGKHPVRLPAPCARRRLVVRNPPDMHLIEGSPLYFHQGKVLAIINPPISIIIRTSGDSFRRLFFQSQLTTICDGECQWKEIHLL